MRVREGGRGGWGWCLEGSKGLRVGGGVERTDSVSMGEDSSWMS
jgi:hypothetical protein